MCTVEGCENCAQHGGLCGKHYARQRRHGDALRLKKGPPDGGWRAFEQARAFARELNLIGPAQYKAWARTDARPPDIPARPDWVYRTHGWNGWGDWLRAVPVKRAGSRPRRAAALAPTGITLAADRPVHIYALTEPGQEWAIRYVGQVWQPRGWSADEALQKRLREHIYTARSTTESANHRTNWIRSVLKKGATPGIILLDTGTVENADDLETFYIRSHRAAGFYLTNNGDGGGTNRGKKIGPAWNKGRKHPPEQIKKMKGIKRTPEQIERTAAALRGRKQSPETVAKRLATMKITAPDRGAHIAAANRGKKRTPEQIERIKAGRAKAGWNYSPETRAKIGAAAKGRPSAMKGKTHSPEARAKMRVSHLGKEPANKGKPYCVHGHEYTPENTYMNEKGCRVCKTCKQIAYQKRQMRLREERLASREARD